MSVYGFTVNVDGNSVQMMKKIEASLGEMGVKAKVEAREVESSLSQMGKRVGGIFGDLKSMLLGGLGIGAAFEGFEMMKEGIKESENLKVAQAELANSMQNVGKYSSEAFAEMGEAMEKFHSKTEIGRAS